MFPFEMVRLPYSAKTCTPAAYAEGMHPTCRGSGGRGAAH